VHPVQARANFVIAGAPAGGAFNQATGDTIAIDSQLTDTAGGVFIANLPGVLAVMLGR
jgi:hypothetical protein